MTPGTKPAPSVVLGGRSSEGLIRACDLVLAALGLVAAAPLFLIIVPLLALTGEGEMFYRQTRIGKGARPFSLIKFATMRKNSSSTGAGELTVPGDPRVLPVGRFLRKTKLNEIPQLLNVITGDLSVIGPRPQTERYYNMFSPDQRAVLAHVRPGLSGVGSVIFRDEERLLSQVEDPSAFDDRVIMPYKGQLETWFVAHRSFGLYVELIGLTLVAVLLPGAAVHRRLLTRVPAPPQELAPLLAGSGRPTI